MRLSEAIVIESPQSDMEQRNRAVEAYEKLITAFERMGGTMGMLPRQNGLYGHPSTLNHPEGIALILHHKEPNDRRIGGISTKDGVKNVHLFVDMDDDVAEQMKTRTYRKTLIHEFTHIFDAERMRVMNPTSNMGYSQYYNDPSETNAYTQEAIDDFEVIFRRLTPKARENQLDKMSQSFEEFLDLMRVYLVDRDFIDALNNKNNRNMIRRLYRYWDEVVKTKLLR